MAQEDRKSDQEKSESEEPTGFSIGQLLKDQHALEEKMQNILKDTGIPMSLRKFNNLKSLMESFWKAGFKIFLHSFLCHMASNLILRAGPPSR